MCVVIDLDAVCLVCLQPSKDMKLIFTTDDDDAEMQIAQKISILSELKIDQNNRTLPRKICSKCIQDLKAAWRFRKNCQAAVTIFQTIVRLGDVQPQTTAKKELDEQQFKVPPGLHIKRISIDNVEDASVKANPSSEDPEEAFSEHFTINDVKAEGSVCGELESTNQDEETPEFHTIEEADESEGCEDDDESNIVEYYVTQDVTTDESVPKIYQKIFVEEKLAKTKKSAVDDNEDNTTKTYTIETSDKPVSSSRPKRQIVLQKEMGKSTNVVQTKTKGVVVVDNTNSSEEVKTTVRPVRQVKTRKRKSLSEDVKTPKICDLCGNTYRYQHALNAHMRRHNNDKPFPCECCDKAFVSNVELRRHMRVHTGQKPYACQYCERRFSDFGSRIKHERTHTGERPYHCITCGKSFAYPHVLSVHVLTHTGEKRFRCDYCSKGFTKKAYLASHVKQHHSVPRSFHVVIDDTMDNNQSHLIEGSICTAERIAELEEDSYEEPDEIIITPKLEVQDETQT